MKPEVAVISVGAATQQGRRSFHPRGESLTSLAHVGLVIQTDASNHDCENDPPISPIVANGTIRIVVTGDRYRFDTLPETSSLGDPTTMFDATCAVSSGCRK